MRLLGFLFTLLLGIGIGGWLYLSGKLPNAFKPDVTASTTTYPAGAVNIFKGNAIVEMLAPKGTLETYAHESHSE